MNNLNEEIINKDELEILKLKANIFDILQQETIITQQFQELEKLKIEYTEKLKSKLNIK